ncbi:putative transposase-associated domain-containing protein [Tanacetum coccineum]|uniref:Transposase-associated domain-containing protein n=1 Tax=Tanacetum coccineum TaxID=301880 RepID=A0ABQ5ESR8_9ASTR
MGLPAWQSVCLQFDPRATRGHLMIGKDSRVKIKTERSVIKVIILLAEHWEHSRRVDINKTQGLNIPTDGLATVEMVNATKDNFDEDDLVKFEELLLDAEKPLYEGCPDFTKLSAIVKLLNLKGKYGASDKFFTELLGLIKKMLPAHNEMVEKTYQAKKVMKLMRSGYKKIHACINNCLLYWKDDKDLTVCRTSGISRWKVDNKTHKVYENIPAKVMWYFPIIPRLQRLFKIQSISEDLRWHATWRITDGVLHHPTDSQAWRTIDEKFPKIAKDPRNLWLGISANGVDVNTGNRHHSVWPVLTVIDNLPPWLYMKRKFIMLSVLLSRYPGNDIDVFLELLVDDLHTLFKTGVDTYDVSTKDNFNLRVVVLWIINDYPALDERWNARLDLPDLGVKPELFVMLEEYKTTLPPAGYTLTNVEKDTFCEMLHNIRMYPFERCMKVIKGHVRNRNKPEECITEETIAKETIEFFSEYHKSMETIGIPPHKHETDENEEGQPLSAGKSNEIVPYIERHKQVLKTENPGKRIAFLENEHSKSFAKWLRKEVERELAISKESVSETVRWISYGPRATVVKYDAYNINGYTFRTKCHDGKVYQNSGVSVEAIDLHISKEVATTRQAFYYGVLQEIWVLDYRFRRIPLSKCDWINHRAGGVKRDNLGYTLVDLNNLGHKIPPKNYKDTYDEVDEEFSTVIPHRNDNILPCVNRRDLDSSSDNNSDSYNTSQISTFEEIDYDSPESPKSLIKWYHYLSDEYKDNGRMLSCYTLFSSQEIIDMSSQNSLDTEMAAKNSALVFLWAINTRHARSYGCDTIEEYLEWNYFSSTDNEITNMETTNKGNTDKDCIDDFNSAMSKGKYVPVCKKHNPNMYNPVPVTGCVLGLTSVTNMDDIEKKMGARKSKT